MKAVMRFLRRLWFFGSATDDALTATRSEHTDRSGHLSRGQDWV